MKIVRAYRRTDNGSLEICTTAVNNAGTPIDSESGTPLQTEGEVVVLRGWPDGACLVCDYDKLLVPVEAQEVNND